MYLPFTFYSLQKDETHWALRKKLCCYALRLTRRRPRKPLTDHFVPPFYVVELGADIFFPLTELGHSHVGG
jgi:hypothetical protein